VIIFNTALYQLKKRPDMSKSIYKAHIKITNTVRVLLYYIQFGAWFLSDVQISRVTPGVCAQYDSGGYGWDL
jgi:hypothetical protein